METQNAKPNQGTPPIDALTRELLFDLRDELNALKELLTLREDVGFSTRYLLQVHIGELPQHIHEKIYDATDQALATSFDEQIVGTIRRCEGLISELYHRMTGGKSE